MRGLVECIHLIASSIVLQSGKGVIIWSILIMREIHSSGACFSFTSYHTLSSCSSERHLKDKILAPLAKFLIFFHPLFYLLCCEYAVLRSVAFCVAGLSCSIGPSVITNLKWVKWGFFLTIFLLRMFSLCLVNCVLWYVVLMAVEHLQLPLTPTGALGYAVPLKIRLWLSVLKVMVSSDERNITMV